MNNHLSYKMEGDKSTNYSDEFYKNVKLIGFVKTDSETIPGYKNEGFQWGSSDDLSGYPPAYTTQSDMVPKKEPDNDSTVLPICLDTVHRCCTKKVLYKRLPILRWLPKYTLKDQGVSDLVAGITVGLTVIPQAIAFANVAGLPPQIGLYSSFMACFVYTIFGSCKDPAIGPTAIMAIMTRENIHGMGPEFAVLLTFITGIIQLIMGFAQLGFLIDFISGPVSAGFTSAAAIVIATSQMKDLLGINIKSSSFIGVWDQLATHIKEISIGDGTLGITCMIVLLLLRKMKDIQIGPRDTKEKTTAQRMLMSTIWLISTARNIIVVVFCAMLGYMYEKHGRLPFKLSSRVEPGLPDFQPPAFETTAKNETYNFIDMASKLGSGILVVPLLSILENISLAKFFADGKTVDATQEMLALGACNLISSFVGSMPVSGALSRGAVNNASGVKTTFGGIYTGIIVIVALQFFTPYFVYIPKAALAAVIIAAVVFMVELHVVKPMWRTKKIDLIPAFATFLCSLLIRLEVGIVVGIAINVIILLYTLARPRVHVEKRKNDFGHEYLVITPDRSLVFPSVEYVRSVVTKAGLKQGLSSIPVVIDCRHIQGADFTAANGVKSLIDDFVRRNQPLVFYKVKPSVISIFQGVRPAEFNCCGTEQQLHDMLKGYYFNRVPPM
ncbi:sodium-independent sulfate anion transporter-like [Adelges cooleyi]|uniref:sodium-independent sulfate anion transporter-like n=1 Tax=Adelges cooleyi TaxID=133065 RepID=UPI00217FFF0F|nr:sodium-independent sulfate anion transporter-like [Adelges cooleyi]XP_050432631.1 sodium-independent sulfate anion transporter-like [Adelges cooleyi]XP_050432632.1 sodium-independent sulfate anion transporter-like [Adelges cooleyi]XP_050432633.1 sodium-independent sulfate anion transporter-like [Adelges cooleyi]XP_050432636.1 sodium-independent sulfate anion transporter-like [Adelges cooleyi]XP_050432637.1 sodium-independent sulfate anion transporter-like [Adelges cooleyi]XP_050432638.1 so